MRISYWSSDVCSSDLKTIYGRNYLSSSFWGVLIGDSFEGAKHGVFSKVGGMPQPFPKDRNYYFQEEEVRGYTNATPSVGLTKINEFFKEDYLTPYVGDRKSTRLNPVTNAQLVCRLLL